MTPAQWLLEPWTYEFMQRALVVTGVAAVVCALLSCWLVLVGWSLLGDAVSHAVLPGVVASYVLGLPFALGALVFGLGAVGLIGAVRSRTTLREDTAIGVVFTALFALGVVGVSVTPSHIDLSHILFGNVLGVSQTDFVQVVVLGAATMLTLVLLRRDLTLVAFDPVHAHALGLSPRRVRWVLLVALAITVVVALQAVGVVLVVAMVITPGATARLLTDRLPRMLVVAPVIGLVSAVIGLQASFHLDAASGAMVVLVQSVLFAGALVVRSLRSGRAASAAGRRTAATDSPPESPPAADTRVKESP